MPAQPEYTLNSNAQGLSKGHFIIFNTSVTSRHRESGLAFWRPDVTHPASSRLCYDTIETRPQLIARTDLVALGPTSIKPQIKPAPADDR